MHSLVSVIVPVYNAAATIAETIASVYSQQYSNWELILVDDGSKDNSLEILSGYNDPRVKVFSQPNRGVAAARNLGISKASGKYIAFLDADDLWRADKLQKSLEALTSGSYALVYTDVMEFESDLKMARFHTYSEPVDVNDDYHRLLTHDYISTLTVVVEKEVLDTVGNFDEMLFGTEDWDLWIRIAQAHSIFKVEEPLSFYRYSANGLSKNRDKHLKEELKVLNKHVLHNHALPTEIRNKAKWVWLKKVFYNHIKEKRYLAGLQAYAGMWWLRPFARANFFFLRRRNG